MDDGEVRVWDLCSGLLVTEARHCQLKAGGDIDTKGKEVTARGESAMLLW